MKKIISLFILLLSLPILSFAKDVEFKPVSYYTDFQVDSHYIITVYNKDDHNWYALGTSEDGETISVKIDNPKNGLKIDEKQVKKLNYIFTCPKKTDASTIKLRSNVIEEETGKKYSLYLKNGLINKSGGGDIYLGNTLYNGAYYFSLRGSSNLYYYSEENAFTFDKNNDYYSYQEIYAYDLDGNFKKVKDYYSSSIPLLKTNTFYVLSDVELVDGDERPTTLYKNNTMAEINDNFNDMSSTNRFQFVYTAGDGKKYIPTKDGAKVISENDNSITTEDYLYFRYKPHSQLTSAYATKQSGKFYYYEIVSSENLVINGDKIFHFGDIASNDLFKDIGNGYTYSLYLIYGDSNGYYSNPVLSYDSNYFLDVAYKNKTVKAKVCYNIIRCLSWNNTTKQFEVVGVEDGILFDVYTENKADGFYEYSLCENYGEYDYCGSSYYSTKNLTTEQLTTQLSLYSDNIIGFTNYKDVPRIIEEDDKENIRYFNREANKSDLIQSIKDKYHLIEKISDVEPNADGVREIYLVEGNEKIDIEPFIAEDNGHAIIGVSDWKNTQEGKTEEYLETHEKTQGSVTVELYLDGKKWLDPGKVYYRYDNDNSADLNIKFLNNKNTNVNDYLVSKDDFQPSADNLVIVGVNAEQGGSEEGLYVPFNWMSENGGQLDNVKGGSIVKIYLTQKYSLKYYLNDELYKSDDLTYVPTITKELIKENSTKSNYVVNDETNNDLLVTTSDKEYAFKDELARGLYYSFNYELAKQLDLAKVFDLPDADVLAAYWAIKDEDGTIISTAKPGEFIQLLSMEDVDFLFVGKDDDINTIHLHAYTKDYDKAPEIDETESNSISIKEPEKVEEIKEEKEIKEELDNPKTGDWISLLIIILISSFAVNIIVSSKVRKI